MSGHLGGKDVSAPHKGDHPQQIMTPPFHNRIRKVRGGALPNPAPKMAIRVQSVELNRLLSRTRVESDQDLSAVSFIRRILYGHVCARKPAHHPGLRILNGRRLT